MFPYKRLNEIFDYVKQDNIVSVKQLSSLLNITDRTIRSDIQAINDMLRDYYETMSPICSKCPVKRLCPICFTACLGDDGKFTRSQIGDCKNVHESVRNKFTYVYNLLEKGVRADKLLSLNADRSAKKNEVPERRLFQYEEIHDIK